MDLRFVGSCLRREGQGRRTLLRVQCVLLEMARRSLRRGMSRLGRSLVAHSLFERECCSARRRRRIHFVELRSSSTKKVGGRAVGGPRLFGSFLYIRAGVECGWSWLLQVHFVRFVYTMIPCLGTRCRNQSVSPLCLRWFSDRSIGHCG